MKKQLMLPRRNGQKNKACRIRKLQQCIARGGHLAGRVGNDGYRVGYVCGMTSDDWQLCPSYLPSRVELRELTYHWFVQYFDVHLYMFATETSGSTEIHIAEYSATRLKMLREQLGEQEFVRIQGDVEEAFSQRFGTAWDYFQNRPQDSQLI